MELFEDNKAVKCMVTKSKKSAILKNFTSGAI